MVPAAVTGRGPSEGPPAVGDPPFGTPLILYRAAVGAVALWSLLATTLLLWIVARGGFVAVDTLLWHPSLLLSARAAAFWALGAAGAFGLFALAFAVSQAVGRGLVGIGARPLPWPAGVPAPGVPVRLLTFRSVRRDSFTFTLLFPSLRRRWSREEVILVSDGLLATLSPVEWEAVLAHELGHIRALDGRYLTFLRTFARLLWWDPILGAVAARLTRREEFRADDAAVALTGRPRALARAIYKAARLPSTAGEPSAALLGPGGARGRRQAVERIQRLVELAETGRYREEEGA